MNMNRNNIIYNLHTVQHIINLYKYNITSFTFMTALADEMPEE
jgi:hypothetical protein